MTKRNEFTEAVLDINGEIKTLREDADKAFAVPFMQEQVTAEQQRKRLMADTPENRAAFVRKHGVRETMKLLRGGR